MFKNLYRQQDYTIVEAPYQLRGAFLPKKGKLDAALKEQEKGEAEKVHDLAAEAQRLLEEITRRKSDIEVLKEHYNSMVGKAEEEASAILVNARTEAENLKAIKTKQGYEEGFDKGYYDGLEKGKAEINTKYENLIKALASIVTGASSEKSRIIRESEIEMVELSIDVAKKVVNSEISVNKTLVVNFVKEAIKRLEDKEKIIIYANPDDIETIKMHRGEFAELTDAENVIHILPDDMLDRGECRLESNTEIIDTDINQQFGVIGKKLSSGE